MMGHIAEPMAAAQSKGYAELSPNDRRIVDDFVNARCRHEHLHSLAGGLYLACCACGRRYGALMERFDVVDPMARGDGIPDGELRSNPSMQHSPHETNRTDLAQRFPGVSGRYSPG